MRLLLDPFFLIKLAVGGVGNVGNAIAFSKVWGKRALMTRVLRLDIRKRFPQTGIVHTPFPFSTSAPWIKSRAGSVGRPESSSEPAPYLIRGQALES